MPKANGYPTVYDMLHRKPAVARSMSFQNHNFANATIRHLLKDEIDLEDRLEAKALALAALQSSRRNAETARFTGFRLPG